MPTSSDSPLGDAYTSLAPADAIRLWMDHYELSETDAALATGLPLNTVTRLLRGSQSVTDEIARALATATGVAAWRWLALQRHHAVWTASVDSLLAALDGQGSTILPIRSARLTPLDQAGRRQSVTTKGFGYVQFTIDRDQDQERPVDQQSRVLPLYGSSTLYQLADMWRDRVELGAGPETTAAVLVELATLLRASGLTYVNASDLETLAVGVRSVEQDSPSPEPGAAGDS